MLNLELDLESQCVSVSKTPSGTYFPHASSTLISEMAKEENKTKVELYLRNVLPFSAVPTSRLTNDGITFVATLIWCLISQHSSDTLLPLIVAH